MPAPDRPVWQKLSYIVSVIGIAWIPLTTRSAEIGSSEAPEISQSEQISLAKKATAGDGAAAYQLYSDLTIDRGEDAARTADPWLLLAVKLHNDEAERLLAMEIENGNHAYRPFGATQTQAVENLLKESSKTYGLSCDDLAYHYAEGYFGSKDYVHAREYYLMGAQFKIEFCWYPLAKLCYEGLGGPIDDRSAYYWVSLDAKCVSPASMSGTEIWALRDKIAARLPLSVLRQEWLKIDDFDTSKVYPTPFLNGYTKKSDSESSCREAASKEREHRQQLEDRG